MLNDSKIKIISCRQEKEEVAGRLQWRQMVYELAWRKNFTKDNIFTK